jgi:hypothetical protein
MPARPSVRGMELIPQSETAADSVPRQPTGKSCGTCTACCKITGVQALQKPAGVWCPHCEIGHGRKTYPQRPADCRDFHCGWLLNSHMGPELRPDRCHVVLMWMDDKRALIAACDPGRQDAWRAPNVLGMLRQFAIKLGADWKVVVMIGKRKWLVTDRAILSEAGDATPLVDLR